MDFIINNLWVLWLIVAAVMLLIEISTEALVSIWFVISGVLTAILAAFVGNFAIQAAFFFVCSAVLLFTLRGLYKKKIYKEDTDEELKYSMVGKTATAAENINKHSGKVLLGDVYWRAVCEGDNEIVNGTKVTVVAEDGTTLIVCAEK